MEGYASMNLVYELGGNKTNHEKVKYTFRVINAQKMR